MPEFERIRDRELVRRFRAGDRDALSELYRLHSGAVFRFVLHMTADENKAGELTQDIFVWLIQNAGRWDPDRADFRSFLLGVARMKLKRHLSEEQRWMPLEEATLVNDPHRGGTAEEDAQVLRRAILALPERYREVVVLCDLQEKTHEEAAAVMECSVGTVKSRLHRARALLARKLMGKGCPA